MSRNEQSSNSKKIMTVSVSNESSNRKEEVPIKTTQSLNTESYEYFNQKITTNNNITESSAKTLNQKSNTKSLKCTCNQDLSSNKKEFNCICNQSSGLVQCTCNQGLTTGAMLQCSCGLSKEKCTCNLSAQKQKCTCGLSGQKCTCNLSAQKQKCTCVLSGQKCTCGLGLSAEGIQQNQINISNSKITNKYNNAIQTQTQKISVQNNINNGLKINEEIKESSNINIQAKVCNCGNSKVSLQTKSKTVVSKVNINKTSSQGEWNETCVGQNNENLQIFPREKPELLVQCVQDIKVIQEPKPVQILIPVVPYEIDYPLGLEIYGKQKKVFICPENVDNLDVSKAYSKIEPHFENLNIGQNENVQCDKIQKKQQELSMQKENFDLKKEKKDKYESLEKENAEMFVKGQKDFNKNNEVELTTKMNVVEKQKLSWNETNEAIKTTKMNIDKNERTKFENLQKEQNAYNYEGKTKNKFSAEELNLESNDDINYPAEFVPTDWNKTTIPMSGKPFTLEKVEKKVDIATTKGDKITLKKEYETTDWNKKNRNRKEVQINMVKRTRKAPLIKQKNQQVNIKGKENDWNDLISKENDVTLQIDKTKVQNEFVLSRGDEVTISNEGEEILVNDDYNIVEENYTRPIRANIQKVQEYSEESISSEYDVLKGIQKYMGEYQYKELVNESLKIRGPNIIINDISGKYPRRIETFHGLDENFEKLSNDQIEQQKMGGKYKVRIDIQKKEVNQHEYDNEQSQGNENEYENENENENEYEEESDKNNVEPEDGQEPEQNEEQEQEQEEQENMDYPEDKDQNQIPHEQSQEEDNEQMDKKEQSEEKNDSEPKDEMEQEQSQEKEQPEDLNQNEEEEVKDTQPKEEGPKIYIKEITYTNHEQDGEKAQMNLKYITLKRKEEQEDSSSQPVDHNEEEAVAQSEKEVKVEKLERAQYITMESQKVDEQHMSKSENDIKSDLEQELEKKEEKVENEENKEIKKEENIQSQYLTMPSQKVDEQHISRDEGEPENELDEEIKKKEEINALENKEENKDNILIEKEKLEKQEIEIQEKKDEQQEEKHEQEQVKEKIEGQIEVHMEGQSEEHVEEYEEEHVEEQGEEQVEEHEEEQGEEHEEEQGEEHEEEQVEEHNEEQVEEHEEEHNEEQGEEHAGQLEEEHIEEHSGQLEEAGEGHIKKQIIEQKKEMEAEVNKEEEKLEQKQEIHEQEKEKELVQGGEIKVETKQKTKTLSQIVSNTIKAEMKEQEMKNEHEINMASKQLIKSRADPSDSINKLSSNKVNIQSSQSSQGQKVVTKTYQQNVQTEVVINPMLYSFGQGSVENSNFSNANENINYTNNYQGSGITFGQDGIFTTSYISGSGLNFGINYGNNYGSNYGSNYDSNYGSNFGSNYGSNYNNINTQQQIISNYTTKSNVQSQSSNLGISGKYYFSKGYSSRTYTGKSLREPMDTIKGRKKIENVMKAENEIGELTYGPRDSKRK